MASSRCSVETYSSLKFEASLKAWSSSLLALVRQRGLRGASGDFGKLFDLAIDLGEHGLRANADLFQHGRNDAFFVFEQRRQQVQRQQFGIAVLGGELVRALDRFLRFDGEFVPTDGHGDTSYSMIAKFSN